MQARTISIPTLALIGSTRGMLGAGLGLLLANKLSDERRRGVGKSLMAVGLLSTIPLVFHIFRSKSDSETPQLASAAEEPVRRGRHQMLPISKAGTVDAQRR
jgi:hypothetical protein